MKLDYKADDSCELHILSMACDLERQRKGYDKDLESLIIGLYVKLYLKTKDFETLQKPTKSDKMASRIITRALAITRQPSLAAKDEQI
jgi:hypothetical protein